MTTALIIAIIAAVLFLGGAVVGAVVVGRHRYADGYAAALSEVEEHIVSEQRDAFDSDIEAQRGDTPGQILFPESFPAAIRPEPRPGCKP